MWEADKGRYADRAREPRRGATITCEFEGWYAELIGIDFFGTSCTGKRHAVVVQTVGAPFDTALAAVAFGKPALCKRSTGASNALTREMTRAAKSGGTVAMTAFDHVGSSGDALRSAARGGGGDHREMPLTGDATTVVRRTVP